jgi:cytoskeleton protein RodZ
MPERTAPAAGIRLKSVREAKGLSLHDIAHATKISTRTLEAVERGDFARVPGGIYARAVIRSYAASVGLDANAILDEFLRDCPSHIEPIPTLVADHADVRTTESLFATIASLIAPLLRTTAVPLTVGLALAAGYVALSRPSPPALLPSSAVDLLAVNGLHAAPAAPSVMRVSQMLDAEAPAGREASPLVVEIQADAPCWISIRVDGGGAGSRLLDAGDRAMIEAEREIILEVGDAGAVSLWINGRQAPRLGGPGAVVTTRITAPDAPEPLGS